MKDRIDNNKKIKISDLIDPDKCLSTSQIVNPKPTIIDESKLTVRRNIVAKFDKIEATPNPQTINKARKVANNSERILNNIINRDEDNLQL